MKKRLFGITVFIALIGFIMLACGGSSGGGGNNSNGGNGGNGDTTFTITMQNDGNGKANTNKQFAAAGEKVTISAMSNSGYKFLRWEVISGNVTLSGTADSPAEFTMPGRNVTIKALFEALPPDTPYLVLDPAIVTFENVSLGYSQPAARTVTIRNTGTGTASVTSIQLSNESSFTLSDQGAITTIAIEGTAEFTVQPRTGLGGGTHNAVITVTYDGEAKAHANIRITVEVEKANQAAFSIVNPGAKNIVSVPFTLSTTGGSGTGAVSFSVTSGVDVIEISGSTVIIRRLGSAVVTATKAGDHNYNPVTSAQITITVNPSPPPQIEMVWISAGTFTMGGSDVVLDWNAQPPHQVTLTQGFYMGKYLVTQEQYAAVMGVNPSSFASNPAHGEVQGMRPVENVSWYDALVFCNRLSMLEGLTPAYRINGSTNPDAWGSVPTSSNTTWDAVEIVAGSTGYRLPTEAQWEYACRAGTTTAFNTGDTITNDTGWYLHNSGGMTRQVGLKPANAWGLHDMHGNVWEWCWDWYAAYPGGARIDPTGESSGTNRVFRGGSWFNVAQNLRSANRFYINFDPPSRNYFLGFRVLRP